MSKTMKYDVVVVGMGAMGSAALYHLAGQGKRVLGLDRFDVPHEFGSSHGESRIIRLAYFEHPDYVPLLRRAYELWDQLSAEVGDEVLVRTGSLDMSREGEGVFDEALASCLIHDIPHEALSSEQVEARYPGFRLPKGVRGLYQKDGGFLRPERAVMAHLRRGVERGASVRTGVQVVGWEASPRGVHVATNQGEILTETLIVTAGAWASDLLQLPELLQPERQVLLWTKPLRPDLYTADVFPVYNLRLPEGHFYGFPSDEVPGRGLRGPKEAGVKLGRYHHRYEVVHPDTMEREAGPEDEAVMRGFLEEVLPDANGPTLAMKTCLFTNTPDEHFILDWLPGTDQRVVVGAGFSGHGFKFASVIGECLSRLATGQPVGHDIDFLGLRRFEADR